MGDFAADTEIKGGDGRYTADLSADWEAWGPNGGYLAAILLRAAGASGGQPRPASMTCHFLAVADSDRVDLTARILRSSRRAQSIRTTMEQNGRPIAEAMVWLVSNGLDGVTHDVAIMPDVSGPEELRPIEELSDDSPDGVPPFWSNFEWRPTLWHPDWQAREPGAPPWHGWYRYGERPTEPEDPILAAARTLPLLDVMGWAAAYEAHPPDVPYIAPNLDLNVQFHRVISPSEWLFADATSRVAGEGLVGFSNTIWSEDRRLLASASGQLLCRPVR